MAQQVKVLGIFERSEFDLWNHMMEGENRTLQAVHSTSHECYGMQAYKYPSVCTHKHTSKHTHTEWGRINDYNNSQMK